MKDLSRRSFVKKSVAGGLIAANLTVFSGIVRAAGGGGGTTTGDTTLPFTTGMTTATTIWPGGSVACDDVGVQRDECCELNSKKVYKCTKDGVVIGYCDANHVKSSTAKAHCEP